MSKILRKKQESDQFAVNSIDVQFLTKVESRIDLLYIVQELWDSIVSLRYRKHFIDLSLMWIGYE